MRERKVVVNRGESETYEMNVASKIPLFTDYPEPPGAGTVICSHFGCRKELTPREQLFGDRCVDHQKGKIDVMRVVRMN